MENMLYEENCYVNFLNLYLLCLSTLNQGNELIFAKFRKSQKSLEKKPKTSQI